MAFILPSKQWKLKRKINSIILTLFGRIYIYIIKHQNPNLPITRVANAVVPDASAASREQASAKALSACRNAEATILSISLGKSSSSTMNFGR